MLCECSNWAWEDVFLQAVSNHHPGCEYYTPPMTWAYEVIYNNKSVFVIAEDEWEAKDLAYPTFMDEDSYSHMFVYKMKPKDMYDMKIVPAFNCKTVAEWYKAFGNTPVVLQPDMSKEVDKEINNYLKENSSEEASI